MYTISTFLNPRDICIIYAHYLNMFTFGRMVASRSPVSKYLKTVVTFSISLAVSCSPPTTGPAPAPASHPPCS